VTMAAGRECYNAKICARSHTHALQNTKAETEYPRMEMVTPGLSLDMCGKKTGTFLRRHFGDMFSNRLLEETLHQPSHLQVRVNVHKSLLREAEHVYPCRRFNYKSEADELTFEFLDANAFCFFIRRLTVELRKTEAAIVGYFADWERLDAKKERRAAIALQKKALEKMYSPEAGFFHSQARHDWHVESRRDMPYVD
jgi:hypothetical protein